MNLKLFLGRDVQIAVTPTLIKMSDGARHRFDPIRRKCYFEDEISLAHFPVEDSYRFEEYFFSDPFMTLLQTKIWLISSAIY